MRQRLFYATTNPGKLAEFRLAGDRFAEPLPNLADIPPSPEDGITFEENAIQKAVYYSRFAAGALVFADDSGLAVDALNGEPGVRSARYAGEGAGDEANNKLLLDRLATTDHRSARFVCVIAVAEEGRAVETFRGEVEGEILRAERGNAGFGYDPLFFYPPFGKTLAEIEPEDKFAVSHRGKAMRALGEWLAYRSGH